MFKNKYLFIFVLLIVIFKNSESLEEEDQYLDLYDNAFKRWTNTVANETNMIGRSLDISKIDLEVSKVFLESILRLPKPPQRKYALDCASGIGRITKNVLLHYVDKVDLLDFNDEFLKTAPGYIQDPERIGAYILKDLKDFEPEENKYDILWCQWALNQLKDKDYVEFLKRVSKGIKKNGVVIVKGNIVYNLNRGHKIFRKDIFGFMRSATLQKELAKEAGFLVIKEGIQFYYDDKSCNSEYPKYMTALRIAADCDTNDIDPYLLTLHGSQCF